MATRSQPAEQSVLRRIGTRLSNLPYVLLVLTTLFWSGNFIIGRAVQGMVPPIGLAFWRWAGSSLIVIGFAWPHLRRDWPVVRRSWRIILLLSLLGIAIFNTFAYIGLQYTQAINGFLLQSITPVVIVLLSYLLYRETITLLQAVGVAVSLVGVLVIIARGDLPTLLGLSLNIGDVWIFAAVMCYAGYSTLLRRRPKLHPLSFIAVTFIPGALMLLPFYIWEHIFVKPMVWNTTTLLAVGYVAVFPSLLAYLCYNRGVELVGANRAGLFFHLMPVFGSIMALVFLDERLYLFHAIGIPVILVGIVLATRRQRKDEGVKG